jgi:hypothetical protein
MVVTMMNIVFWDVIACSLVEVSQHFGKIYCLHLACLLDVLFCPEDRGSMVLRNISKLLQD